MLKSNHKNRKKFMYLFKAKKFIYYEKIIKKHIIYYIEYELDIFNIFLNLKIFIIIIIKKNLFNIINLEIIINLTKKKNLN